MANKFIAFLGLLALSESCMAGFASYAIHPLLKTYAASPLIARPVVKTLTSPVFAAAPVGAAVLNANEVDPHSQYNFSYGIHDSITGDVKSHSENRDGGNVAGSYSIFDADGFKRTVTYTADAANGFNAVVNREPIAAKSYFVAASPSAVVHAAPVFKTSTDVASSPIAHGVSFAHASPVLHAAPVINSYTTDTLLHSTPILKSYATSPFVHAAPVVNSYSSIPLAHAAPVIHSYAASPFVHSASVYKTYAATPALHPTSTSVLQSTPILHSNSIFHQLPQFPLQQDQFPYFTSSIPVAGHTPQPEGDTEIQSDERQEPNEQDSEQPQEGSQETQSEEIDNGLTPAIENPEKQQRPDQLQPDLQQQNILNLISQQQLGQQFLSGQIYPPFPIYGIPEQQLPNGQQQPEQQEDNNDSDIIEIRKASNENQKLQLQLERKAEFSNSAASVSSANVGNVQKESVRTRTA